MNKYNRRYEGSNYSPFFYWVGAAAIIAGIIYKVVSCRQNVNELQEMEKQENIYNNVDYIILTDSSGNSDTMSKQEYDAMINRVKDSIKNSRH